MLALRSEFLTMDESGEGVIPKEQYRAVVMTAQISLPRGFLDNFIEDIKEGGEGEYVSVQKIQGIIEMYKTTPQSWKS